MTTTPDTPAGEAVAWIDERDLAELQDGKQAKTVVFHDRFDERDLPLYLQPPATVSADAVLALVGAADAIRQFGADTLSGRMDGPDDREWQRGAVLEMTKRARLLRDELEALTRGEK